MQHFLPAVISVLVVLGIMVLVHEFGHFVAAKFFGVRVEQFSIGFPPRLVGFKIGETDYCVSALPLGGYVKMTGESMPGENMSLNASGGAESDASAAQLPDPGALTSHPRWQRMIIGFAGPFANFVLAIGLMIGYYMFPHQVPLFLSEPIGVDWVTPGSQADQAGIQQGDRIVQFDNANAPTWIDANTRAALDQNSTVPVVVERAGQQLTLHLPLTLDPKSKDAPLTQLGLTPQIQMAPLRVEAVTPHTPAERAGLQPGDVFLSMDGHVFHGVGTVLAYLQQRKGAPVALQIGRNGATISMTVVPEQADAKDGKLWMLGFKPAIPPTRVEKKDFSGAIAASLSFNKENSGLILSVLQRLVTHKMSIGTLSGPIGIAQQTGQAWESRSWEEMVQLMTVISLNLGILNLLPFPILDGGMILFLLIESALRHDIDMRIKERIYQVAFVLIIVFAVFVIYNDITKL